MTVEPSAWRNTPRDWSAREVGAKIGPRYTQEVRHEPWWCAMTLVEAGS